MTLCLTASRLAAVILALSSWLNGQPPSAKPTPPDAKAILARCLAAHRGERPGIPTNLLFVGDVQQRTAKGDINNADIWQWYARETTESGEVREHMLTRMMAKGTDRESIRGFDGRRPKGRRHFVVADKKRVYVRGKPSYKVDLANIDRDLRLTRFLIDHFLAGTMMRSDAKFAYLGTDRLGKLRSHKISRSTSDGVSTIYYVNAEPGQKPFLNGIEFSAAKDQPKRVHHFGSVRKFGPFHVPQEIKITERDDAKATVSIWITQLRTNEKKTPDWADLSRYPRKR